MYNPQKPQIAVVLSGFPRLSESFILHELLEFERQGFQPVIFPLKNGQAGPLISAVKQLEAPRFYVPQELSMQFLRDAWRGFRKLPIGHALKNLTAFILTGKKEKEFIRFKSLLRLLWLCDRLDSMAIQHVHAHFAHDPTTMTFWAARLLQLPYSFTAHAKDIYCYSRKWLARKLASAEFVVTCTDYNRRYLQKRSPNGAPIHCLYHGIDLQQFAPSVRSEASPIRLLAVGRLVEKKGFDYLIDACRQLKNRGLIFHCDIVGDGPLREALEHRIHAHGLQKQVALLGALSPQEVRSHYRRATLFVMPSFVTESGDRDGIPNVILEAMAMQLPVVATRISGIPEAVIDSENGMLVPEKDAEALTDAIYTLLQNPQKLPAMGVAGRARVRQKFSLEANVRQKKELLIAATESKAADLNSPEIAYIIKGYPRLSEAFIANEIDLLETLGQRLSLFVVKKEKEAKRHAVVDRIQAPVTYLPQVSSLTASFFLKWLWQNAPKFAQAHWQLLLAHPQRFVRTLLRAVSYCFLHRSRRFSLPKKAYIKEFLQAGFIAREVLRLGTIRHLHAHFCHGSTTIALFTSELTGLPFSFTAHAKDIYQPRLNPGTLLQKKIHRAQFVTTCTGANHRHLQNVSTNGTPIHTIYHGLDTQKFAIDFERNGTPEPHILAIGRFVEKKGFPYLIEACRILRERGARFRCTIVGEPGEQLSLVEQLIAKYGLQNRVTLRGAMTHPELIAMYRNSDIFVLPCIVAADGDRDGIPNVLAEAMSMSLPVVSTRVSGIPELVSDGQDGILVAQKDENALSAALLQLIEQSALRQQLGQAARAKICRIFDAKHNTVRLKNLFDHAAELHTENNR